ncbi:MAG: cytochrome c [Gammaproteobacteria bacterium]|nr:cytochrome c [Gammaproteobacteria bacterium]MDH5591858.1 cytochrome c [Gammaproteobacteria bacterium]
MNKTKAWIVVFVPAALVVFVIVAIWPALKGGSEGYNTKTAEEVVTKPLAQTVDVSEILVIEEKPPEIQPVTTSDKEKDAGTIATDDLYSVVDGNKLDANSYQGFKLYRNWCARCHGTYGQGMVGPNLADSLNVISKEEFFSVVENGKSGSIGSMPAWKANPKVMDGRDKLYAYLKARADGAIGIEKPVKQ